MPAFTNVQQFSQWRTAFELGLTDVYKDTLQKLPKTYTAWLREVPAERFYDTDWAVSGLGVMPEKNIGGQISTDQIFQGSKKQYTMKTYALALVVQYETFRWDLYGVFPDLIKQLVKTAIDRYNIVAYGMWNQAFSTSDTTYTNYKTEAICSTTHVRMDGGTWTNAAASPVGLSYTGLQGANIDIRKQLDERGRYISLSPKMLICAVEQEWIAKTIIKSQFAPDNNQMQYNSVSDTGLRQIHSSPFITSTSTYFVVCDKEDYKIKISTGDNPALDTDSDVRTMNKVWTSYCSFRFDCYQSHGIWGANP